MFEGEPALACKACQQVVIRDNTGYYPAFFQKKVSAPHPNLLPLRGEGTKVSVYVYKTGIKARENFS
jgi:hypothetical protein